MHIYLVEDVSNSPGNIYACFAHEDDVDIFANLFNSSQDMTKVEVVPRTLFYGEAQTLGYNP